MEKVSPTGPYSLSCKFSDGPLHRRHTSIPLFSLDHFIAPTPDALNSPLEVWGKAKPREKQWQEDREGKPSFTFHPQPDKKLFLLQEGCPQHLQSHPDPTRTRTHISGEVRGWLPTATWAHFHFQTRAWHHPFRIYIAAIHPIKQRLTRLTNSGPACQWMPVLTVTQ